ncbi:hypothetical protein D3C87_1899350 [compost metagenome]
MQITEHFHQRIDYDAAFYGYPFCFFAFVADDEDLLTGIDDGGCGNEQRVARTLGIELHLGVHAGF